MNRSLAVLGMFFLACRPVALASGRAPPRQPEAAAADALPMAEVVVHSASGAMPVRVEVAADPASRHRGLMFRQSVPPGTGMLFVFREPADEAFWMHNTLVPLDMVFIGSDRKIVGIVENAAPQSNESRSVGARSLYVLEVLGGTAFAHGWKRGDRVEMQGLPEPR